jgi:hypothetical protein
MRKIFAVLAIAGAILAASAGVASADNPGMTHNSIHPAMTHN